MRSVVQFVEHAAMRRPDRLAMIEGDIRVTYGEVVGLIHRTANHLRDTGIDPGQRVGLGLGDDHQHVIMLLALAHLGAVILPVDWRLPAPDAAAQMKRFGAEILLSRRASITLKDADVVLVDEQWWERVRESPALDALPAGPAQPFLVALSSGSTGAPDGRLLTHGNITVRFMEYLTCDGFRPDSEFLLAAAISQASGRAYVLYTLKLGNTLILYPSLFDPDEIIQELNRTQARQFFCVPTMVRWLLERASGPEPLLPHLEFLETTGAPLFSEEKIEAAKRVSPGLVEIYASASTGNITRLRPADMISMSDTVGRTTPFAVVEVVDDMGAICPPGTSGQIRVRGPGCALRSALIEGAGDTERSHTIRDGWTYPGEVGSFDDDGYLHLKGRVSDFILRSGTNIHPQEIEAVLQSHPHVIEAAVIGCRSEIHGEEVVAMVLAAQDVSPEILKAHCLERLAPYKVPTRFNFVDTFPRTLSGKIDKLRLRALLEAAMERNNSSELDSRAG